MISADRPYDLTPEQRQFFDTNGYLMLPDLLQAEEVKELQQWAQDTKDWPNKAGEHMPYLETKADGSQGLCR